MPRMGDLADLTQEGMLYGPAPEPQVRREDMPLYVQQAAQAPLGYEPNIGMFPTPRPPAPPQEPQERSYMPFSHWRATPPKPTAGTVMGGLAAPGGPLDVSLMMPGPGWLRGGAALIGGTLEPSEAEAALRIKGGGKQPPMGSILSGVKVKGGPSRGAVSLEEFESAVSPASRQVQEALQSINAPYISNPQRVANPGIYKRPDVIAAEGAARVEPEHPALKELFNVTRQDLYDISQQGRRQGNIETQLWQPGKTTKPNEAALAVMNPANEQRILDTLVEARKYPGLEQGMVPWYVMDPLYQRMAKLVGPERAAKEYMDFNMSMTPFSAGSSVPSEINRGTAANMMRQRGEYDIFKQYGGLKAGARGGADYPEILRDVHGMMGHLNQANPVERYMLTGKHGYGKDQVKIDLYSGASGVPETGFQTTGAVPDAHFTRAIGVPDARSNPKEFNDYMGGTEYRQIGPWYREKIAKPLGIEAVPAQALMWGTYGPQTGVKTKIGAGKLELLSKQMWERAKKLGIDPQEFRDQVLRGEQHSFLSPAMGDLADQSSYG